MGDFKTGTFVYSDRPKGPHKLTFERPGDLSRKSHQVFVGESRRTYFSPRADGKVGLVTGGFIHFICDVGSCGRTRLVRLHSPGMRQQPEKPSPICGWLSGLSGHWQPLGSAMCTSWQRREQSARMERGQNVRMTVARMTRLLLKALHRFT
jgi:hypothetical protein